MMKQLQKERKLVQISKFVTITLLVISCKTSYQSDMPILEKEKHNIINGFLESQNFIKAEIQLNESTKIDWNTVDQCNYDTNKNYKLNLLHKTFLNRLLDSTYFVDDDIKTFAEQNRISHKLNSKLLDLPKGFIVKEIKFNMEESDNVIRNYISNPLINERGDLSLIYWKTASLKYFLVMQKQNGEWTLKTHRLIQHFKCNEGLHN